MRADAAGRVCSVGMRATTAVAPPATGPAAAAKAYVDPGPFPVGLDVDANWPFAPTVISKLKHHI